VGLPSHLLSTEAHPDTVTQLPPLPPLPAHPGAPGPGAEPELPTTAEEPAMPLPPALPLEPLPALAPLPPLPDDDADLEDEPAASGSGTGTGARSQAEVPTAEMVEIDLADDDGYGEPSGPVALQLPPRGRRKRALPSNRLPVPPSTQELSLSDESDTAS
ncbi:MAG TPA: hypothetical protein VIL36_04165, partial [Acidimicrobiales bacterium]